MFKPKVSYSRLSPICVVFLIGCTIPLFFAQLPSATCVAISLCLFLACIYLRRSSCSFLLLVFVIAAIRFTFVADAKITMQLPYALANQVFQFDAEITSFPKRKGGIVRFQAKILSSDSPSLFENTIVSLSCYKCIQNFQLGDKWHFSAKLKPIRGQASWSAFDYKKYALANNIIASGYIKQAESRKLDISINRINSMRLSIRKILKEKLPANEARRQVKSDFSTLSMLLALSIGDKSELTKSTYSVFKDSGISHLIAISGLHIGLIFLCSQVVFLCFLKLTYLVLRLEKTYFFSIQNLSLILALSVAILYAFLAGLTIPTQRAILMLAIYSVSQLCHWKLSLFELLCLTVLIILLINPLNTMLASFWLSIIAVGMICIITRSNDGKILSQLRLAVGIIPITFLFFGGISWVSPLCNFLLIPIVGFFIIPAMFVLLFLSGIGVELSMAWAVLNEVMVFIYSCLKSVTLWQSSASFGVSTIGNWRVTCFALLISFLCLSWKVLIAKRLVFLILILLMLSTPKGNQLKQGELLLTVLDVGQGLATVLETSSSVVVFDTGIGFTESDSAEHIIIPYLSSRGIRKLDHIIVSHGDNDHIGGLSTLLAYSAKAKVLSTTEISAENNSFQTCYDQQWSTDGVNFRLYPEVFTKGNNSSCVLHVSSGFGSVLLPGDIERKAEHRLVVGSRNSLPADVLVLPHHGSNSSSTPAFIHAVKPMIGIASASYFSPHKHPHKQVVTRMKKHSIELLSTATSGSIQILFTKEGIDTREYRANNPRFWYSKF